mmetsp:Transcript_34262/g.77651  ORF Transcript_34262/g.77651 Transcript_34262/m.77651 type:complete len:362 (-) Transcript_34262:537-1622(-)
MALCTSDRDILRICLVNLSGILASIRGGMSTGLTSFFSFVSAASLLALALDQKSSFTSAKMMSSSSAPRFLASESAFFNPSMTCISSSVFGTVSGLSSSSAHRLYASESRSRAACRSFSSAFSPSASSIACVRAALSISSGSGDMHACIQPTAPLFRSACLAASDSSSRFFASSTCLDSTLAPSAALIAFWSSSSSIESRAGFATSFILCRQSASFSFAFALSPASVKVVCSSTSSGCMGGTAGTGAVLGDCFFCFLATALSDSCFFETSSAFRFRGFKNLASAPVSSRVVIAAKRASRGISLGLGMAAMADASCNAVSRFSIVSIPPILPSMTFFIASVSACSAGGSATTTSSAATSLSF